MNPASMPNVAIPRSRFLQDFTHSFDMFHGEIVPVDCFPVIPGDDYTVRKGKAEIIMSTPIAPIFGNIKVKICAFFVPMRLVWSSTEEFFGANKTSAGPQLTTYSIPTRSIYANGVATYSVSHYLGKPYAASDSAKEAAGYGRVSILKERAYWLIVSEWYRNQQLQNPFILNAGNNELIGQVGSSPKTLASDCARVCKQYDIFTAATLSPQYGAAVELPLGTYAPLTRGTEYTMFAADPSGQSTLELNSLQVRDSSDNIVGYSSANIGNTTGAIKSNIYVDLSHATAAKINDIRYAFQLQKYLERANFGSRFFEVLAIHYGVTSPDSRLQRPEYLGGKTSPIVIRTVLSQSGYSATSSQEVGQLGASSITMVDYDGLFSKGFVEPGYVFILASTSHERLYSQGIMREDYKTDRFEIYSPEFANLGDQAILKKEIMVTGDSTDEEVFGYQGHWDEYRYRKNRVSGKLDPCISGSLDFWTLADKYTTRPSLSASFIEEDRSSITRCLVTGASGPDYITDWYIQYAATREMPLYNIPGLIDHFGVM